MKEGWKYLPFEKSIVKVKKQKSIKSKDYKEEGLYPVVSQESSLISGYFDDASILYQHDTPVVIFGDHTQNVKYVDFDFIVGADGVHILSPIAEITPKFFYHQLKSIKLRNLGYARHYKLLKQESIGYPPFPEQERIVSLLDAEFDKIDAIKANAEKQLQDAKALFQSALKDYLTPKEGWEEKRLDEICSKIIAGGDAPNKDFMSKTKTPDYPYPIFSNGVENRGLYGYTNQYKVSTPAITIAARGTIGATFIRLEPFTPVVRLITIIPNDYIDIQFLYYLIKALNLGHTGTTIPQLTVPNIREKKFKFPDKKLQLELVSIFSQIDNKVNLLTANYEQTVTLCNDLKQSILKDIFG